MNWQAHRPITFRGREHGQKDAGVGSFLPGWQRCLGGGGDLSAGAVAQVGGPAGPAT